jgi:glycerol-3-phosphate acyltransferase PlsY
MKFAALLICSYLLGSVPFGLLIAGAYGIDLRKVGSGNIGATNLARALGKRWAYLCFGLDFLKGLLPTIAGGLWLEDASVAGWLWEWLAVGCAAVAGHIYPVYLRFKGGKGVATSFGVAIGLWPYYTICAVIVLIIWIIFVFIWRYISLASLVASAAFPVVLMLSIAIVPGWKISQLWPLLIIATAVPILVFVRHRENVVRLLTGTESRVFERKKPETENQTESAGSA